VNRSAEQLITRAVLPKSLAAAKFTMQNWNQPCAEQPRVCRHGRPLLLAGCGQRGLYRYPDEISGALAARSNAFVGVSRQP
jgi:hypothetical protein